MFHRGQAIGRSKEAQLDGPDLLQRMEKPDGQRWSRARLGLRLAIISKENTSNLRIALFVLRRPRSLQCNELLSDRLAE